MDADTPHVSAAIEADRLLAFERLCRTCAFLIPHPLYSTTWQTDMGPMQVVLPCTDEGPACSAGLMPLQRDGSDCPYFKAKQ